MPPQPELPHPSHVDYDSALGRKFGKEITNYFGSEFSLRDFMWHVANRIGSPLNRVSFLREDHTFLSGAFDHPTTRFLVFRELSPLIDSPTQIHWATYKDVEPLLPFNPYLKAEKEAIEAFDSSKLLPGLVFLGLDETDNDGYQVKSYTGAPRFALDVTPRAPHEQAAKEVVGKLEGAGLGFVVGMRAMHFSADVGMFLLIR